jgi:two-component system nitrate/nitrite response regulator NarL
VEVIKLVIVDDHTLFRNGLYELLTRRNLNVVGMTGVAEEALELVQTSQPDIVLLDLRMGEIGGLDILRSIREALPTQRVIILTTSIEERDVLNALKLGADGYLLKDTDPDDLVRHLYQAHKGETVVAKDFTGLLARAAVSPDTALQSTEKNVYNLTPREMDILSHIAKGESNKHIAGELGIVDGTVKLHVRQVLKKLGVQTRVQAALLAVSERLCEDREDSKSG